MVAFFNFNPCLISPKSALLSLVAAGAFTAGGGGGPLAGGGGGANGGGGALGGGGATGAGGAFVGWAEDLDNDFEDEYILASLELFSMDVVFLKEDFLKI